MIINYDNKNGWYWWKINYLSIISEKWFNIPNSFVIRWKCTSKKLYNLYDKYIKSDIYIVRSSANVEDWNNKSFAGLFESIEWFYSEWKLYYDYKEVLNSVNNVGVKIYLEKLNYKENNIVMNVLIQQYIAWEYSWVYFSLYKWKKYLEYIKWWNALLVNGLVDSSNIYFDDSFNILIAESNKQDKYLDEKLDIIEFWKKNNIVKEKSYNNLINTIKDIEKLFDFPVDIEWTIKNSKGYILQVRPITAL